jgi:MFS family permease
MTAGAKDHALAKAGGALVPLLALAVFINYVDRGNLATAAPLIKDEMKLSASQLGVLLSAFFWSYMPGQLLAGWLADRINAYRTLAVGLAIWSLATAASGLAGGFGAILALRLLLGLGESTAFPCASKLLAQRLPTSRLGAANGLIGAGLALGPAFGTLTGGLLMARMGWRPVFLVFGLVSLLWLAPWVAATRRASSPADRGAGDGEAAPSYLAILKRREVWGASLGQFSANYYLFFLVSWLPLYLVKARGFTLDQMAVLGAMVYLANALSAVGTGWLLDRWIQSGASQNLVRKSAAVGCHLVVTACMLGCAVGGGAVVIACLLIAGLAFGVNGATLFAIAQTLAGPKAAAKWAGVQNGIGTIAGIVAPIVTGVVVDRTGQFTWAFVIAGAVTLVGVLGWGIIIRRIEPLAWPATADPRRPLPVSAGVSRG